MKSPDSVCCFFFYKNQNRYGAGYKWIVKIDASTDSVYYFTITSTTSIKISRYRANINTVSLFDNPSTTRLLQEETDKLYIMSASSYSVSNNGSYVITQIDLANDNAVTQYSMTNKTGTSIRLAYDKEDAYCYRGYICFQNYNLSTHYIYRQEIGNSANVAQISTTDALRLAYPMMARNGKIYFENPSGYSGTWCCYIIDVYSFTLTYPETYTLYDSTSHTYVPVKGFPLMYYLSNGTSNGTFAVRTDYLATINNLDSAVLKTADKTMKVTYTLQEQ